MLAIKTKHGTIYLGLDKTKKHHKWCIYDSDKKFLLCYKRLVEAIKEIRLIKKTNSIGEWLKKQEYIDVCWGSKQDIIKWTKDYQECNGREFDLSWLEHEYNRVGNTYMLFEYSEAYL